MFFAPCIVLDSCQKTFVVNMQLRQCLARDKPFRLKKNKMPEYNCCFIFKKSEVRQKNLNFKIWFQKCQIANSARDQR